VLHGDAAAEPGDAIDVAAADGFRVIEEPVDALERNVPVDLLEDVERAADRLVIGRVQPPRGNRFSASSRTTRSSSGSMPAGMSGRGSRKSSKSAAENTSISPAPLAR
jgi:hypothetical protein